MEIVECPYLSSLPEDIKVGKDLVISRCASLKSLPKGMTVKGSLQLRGCPSLASLPEGLEVGRGLWVDSHILVPEDTVAKAFFVTGVQVPESLSKRRLTRVELRELNAEQRRVAISVMGTKWLVDNASPKIIDVDDHPLNGQRALLEVEECCILVCGDPSTGRVYYMEVPPRTKTCQEADAYLNHGLDQRRQVGRT